MFSLRKNTSSASSSPRWNSPKDKHKDKDFLENDFAPARFSRLLPSTSLEPAIDGPPSPENIRAYTEQMKRSSFFTNNNPSAVSSSASSFYSGSQSPTTSRDASLSRTSSRRSNASSMPSSRERPDSIQIFGKAIFSRRSSRKSQHDANTGSMSSSTLSMTTSHLEEPARERYYGKVGRSNTLSGSPSEREDPKSRISKPFNFQHIVHTPREQVPSLLSLRTSTAHSPSLGSGHLKGIRASDLHFENFSDERLPLSPTPELEPAEFDRPMTSPAKRNTLRKSSLPSTSPRIQTRPRLTHAKSHDGLRPSTLPLGTPPLRPPRSPLEPKFASPLPPPPRTSSRTPSMLWDQSYDVLATTSLERPETTAGWRKPKAFHLPISPPRPITRSLEPDDLSSFPSPPRTTGGESWPLTPGGSNGDGPLADVPEEETEEAPAPRRISMASSLRYSKSVPAFSMLSHSQDSFDEAQERPMTPLSHYEGDAGEIGIALSPNRQEEMVLEPGLGHENGIENESWTWEDDIDYCYEHEAEADCEYDWDRCSFDVSRPNVPENKRASFIQQQQLQQQQRRSSTLQNSHLVPSQLDLPALSPSAVSVLSPGGLQPYTPGPTQTSSTRRMSHLHVRSPSHASSFKESHGFHLSPSLLIPGDYAKAMTVSSSPLDLNIDQAEAEDHLYDELFSRRHEEGRTEGSEDFQHHPFANSGLRDSQDSQASQQLSSATLSGRSSALSKSASLESVVLLSRAGNVAVQHRSISIGSSSSLPELVHSLHLSREMGAAAGMDLGQRPSKAGSLVSRSDVVNAKEMLRDVQLEIAPGVKILQQEKPEVAPLAVQKVAEKEEERKKEIKDEKKAFLVKRSRSSSTSTLNSRKETKNQAPFVGRKRAGSSSASYLLFPAVLAASTEAI